MALKLQLTEFLKQNFNPKMGEFEGFEIPLEYQSCIDEHKLTRSKATITDISHLRVYSLSARSLKEIDYLCPFSLDFTNSFKAQYVVFLNDSGGIVEDGMLYLTDQVYFVGNACNKNILPSYFSSFGIDFKLLEPIILVIQGPQATSLIKKIGITYPKTKNGICLMDNELMFVSRTGYSGEISFELFLSSQNLAVEIIKQTVQEGYSITGLVARDTLRLEAGLPLYGNELTQSFSPLESGFEDQIDFSKNFIGKLGLKKEYKLCLFILESFEGIPRKGFEIVDDNDNVMGFVTSGAKTPCIDVPIGFCRIKNTETELFVKLRNKKLKINIISRQDLRKKIKT